MRYKEIVARTAHDELAHYLPKLTSHTYDDIDALMQRISKKHRISSNKLHNLFIEKYHKTPDEWVKELDDHLIEDGDSQELNIEEEVQKFVKWFSNILKIKELPKIELSDDTQDAQDNHHTGSHVPGDKSVWVYVKNRNLVDILRSVAHELTHVKQGELGLLTPGCSYPGSPVEAHADMVAGKYMKVYGKKHHYIFQ